MKQYVVKLLLATAALMITFGCGGGGGGGGGPTATVGGRIKLVGTGQPLPGATVSLAGRSMVTTASGEFDFTGVPVTPAPQLTVTAQGIKTLSQAVPGLIPNTDNDLGDIWVVDENGSYTANVRGTVVSAENFEPVANATVTLSGQRVITGTTGAFLLTNLPVGLTGDNVGTIFKQGFQIKPINIDIPLGPSPPDNDLGPISLSPPVGPIPGG